MTTQKIVVEATYPSSIWEVWHALTDQAALETWLMPNTFEARVGHRFIFEVAPQHGWSGIVECQVLELTAPYRLVYSWRGGQNQPETFVTFTLTSHGEGTALRLEHAGFEVNDQGFSLRDLLSSGWNTKLLRSNLPGFLSKASRHEMGILVYSQEKERL